ncbi:MAG TPA: hypothetical protein VFW40_00580 [Capsulimonadaceae bacterium]|nr:hypothetical protein [Capsulimonadaceae bacterium]
MREALGHSIETLAEKVRVADKALLDAYSKVLITDSSMNRRLVSYQADKGRARSRWFKYKEAFSTDLVCYLLDRWGVSGGRLLDPFAGSGTALFAAAGREINAVGIELLTIGKEIISARQLLEHDQSEREINTLWEWLGQAPWRSIQHKLPLPTLAITQGAYPPETLASIESYLYCTAQLDQTSRDILRFALLCVLESVSFTRKDGQYLRWDYRSGRRQGAVQFDKGQIIPFDTAIRTKIAQILSDLSVTDGPSSLFPSGRQSGSLDLILGSCLDVMPTMEANSFDLVVTSPPYCNRYDYTRTYALELALLGIGAEGLKALRQQMLSCTVENRAKDLLAINKNWFCAVTAADENPLLQHILSYLDCARESRVLNNTGIARMVRGYFYEMACIIQECSRVLRQGSLMFMVNDNVRYAGISISVDLILSDIAEQLGFTTETILVLPTGKGNSSQQMGTHGREPLRKCVYVWRKV